MIRSGRRFLRSAHPLIIALAMLLVAPPATCQTVPKVEVVLGLGHPNWVTSVAFSRDGARLLSGSRDRTLKLWDAATGALLRTFQGHSGAVTSVAFSPDGARLLSGSEDRTLNLWDAASGALLRIFEGHSREVRSVAFSPDGKRIASGSWGELNLWNSASGMLLRTFQGHSSDVSSVAFSPDGTRLLSGSEDNTLKLWDATSGALLRTFKGHSNSVLSLAFSPDGKRIVSGSEGSHNTLKLWDATSGALLRTFKEQFNSVVSVAFSPDGTRLLSGSHDKTLKLWDAASWALLRTFEGHSNDVQSVAFSPDGARLLSGSADGSIRIWDGRNVAALPHEHGWLLATLIGGRGGEHHWLTMTPDGFFSSGRQGADTLAIVRGLEVTTVEQVHRSLFNPDLVREALAFDAGGEVKAAAKVITLEKVLASGPAPSVRIAAPLADTEVTDDVASVTVQFTDNGKGVGRIEWRVNGVTAAVGARPSGAGRRFSVTQKLALDPGDNLIEVVAYNERNWLSSLSARTLIKYKGPADQARPDLHILAIGINAYVDQGWKGPGGDGAAFGKLELAKTDAETFAMEIEKAAAGYYGKVRVKIALDGAATRAGLKVLVDQMGREIHPRDTFILFAAAHGVSVGGRYYLIPQDHDGGQNPTALARNAISQDMLQDWLANRIKAKRAVVFLDTCESGALIAGHARARSEITGEAAIGRLHEATGRPVLTASAARQYAYEDSGAKLGIRHGLFTWALISALREGDSNRNGLIELSEIVAYVQEQVPKLAAKLGGVGTTKAASGGAIIPVDYKQTARYGSRGEDFVLAKRLSTSRPANTP